VTLTGALEKLQAFGLPALRTADVAAHLAVGPANASQIMVRLARHGYVLRIKRGLWALAGTEPMAIVPYLTAPFPAYISLQSALYHHGMISQIPDVLYCVSLARTRRYRTPLGTISVHHVPDTLFYGYERIGNGAFGMATPEKALLDFLYLGSAKSRLFAALPELEFPPRFSPKRLETMAAKIPDPKRRSYIQSRLNRLLARRP
jgi:predicted transcriptional regulator of viral defense system